MKTFVREINRVKRGDLTMRDFAIQILESTPALEMAEALAEMLVAYPGGVEYDMPEEKTLVSKETYAELQKLFNSIAEKPKDPRGRKAKTKIE